MPKRSQRERGVRETAISRTAAPYIRGAARLAIARELAHRVVVGGQPPLVAAAEIGLTRDQVYKVMRGAAYRRESAELFALVGDEKRGVVAEATRRLCELLPKAVDTTDRILERSTDDAVALRAANSVFDRTGLSTQRRGDEAPTRASIVLTVEQSAVLLDALRVASAIPVIETEKKEKEEEDEEDDDSDTEGEERKPPEQDDEGDEDQGDEEPWRTKVMRA